MKDKERQWNCSRLKEIEQIQQLIVRPDSRL